MKNKTFERVKLNKRFSRLGIALAALLVGAGLARAQWTAPLHPPTTVPSNCVLLTDATVMCQVGETTNNLMRLTPDSSGSYVNGSWSTTNITSLPTTYQPRFFCSAVLADGRVIFIGGEYNDSSAGETNLGFIFDPTADGGMGSWATLNPPDGGTSPWDQIGDSPCVILPNKKLLLGNFKSKQIAQLDPATLTWTDLSPTGKADNNGEEGWTLLPDGTVLTVDTSLSGSSGTPSNIAEIYTRSANSWASTGSTGGVVLDGNGGACCVPEMGPQVLRPDGTVIAFGATTNNAIYNYKTGNWAIGPSFPTPFTCASITYTNFGVADGPGSILPNGNVLVAASPFDAVGNQIHCSNFYEFDGTNLNPAPGNPDASTIVSYGLRMLALPSGDVLVTHGSGAEGLEFYNNGKPYDPSWQPTITSAPANVGQGETYSISGTQFNGLSAGAYYGDDSTFASNYPLVRITNTSSGHVQYARTHDHSTMGVATGTAIVSTNFDAPAALELGASTLEVVANGIPSAPFSINVGLSSTLTYTGSTTSDYNDPTTVSAHLVATGGAALSAQTVIFKLGAGTGTETCPALTNSSGDASCSITPFEVPDEGGDGARLHWPHDVRLRRRRDREGADDRPGRRSPDLRQGGDVCTRLRGWHRDVRSYF